MRRKNGRAVVAAVSGLLGWGTSPCGAQMRTADVLRAGMEVVPAPVGPEIPFQEGTGWTPVLAVEWDRPSARTAAWLRAGWNPTGLRLSIRMPEGTDTAREGAGRAPPAPFQVVAEIEGGAGSYRIRCVPLTEPVSRMTRRLHAYLFNHRLGANAGVGETGHVLCHELSLLGILTDSMETRWGRASEGGLRFDALIPWETLRLPVPAAGTELPLAVHVSQPHQADVSWSGRLALLGREYAAAPPGGGGLRLPGPSVRQPDSLLVGFPLAGRSIPVTELGFELANASGGVVARTAAAGVRPFGSAAFARLPTVGQPDGEYVVRVLRNDRPLAERPVRLVGEEAGMLDRKVKALTTRLAALERRQLSPTLAGHHVRARRILELVPLPPHPDSAARTRSAGLVADAAAVIEALEAGRRPDPRHEGFEHPAGFAADGRHGTTTFVPADSDAAHLTVHAGRAADWSLTPRLYGTFSEPVVYDRPIYSWLEAQRLRNPSFEFGHPTAEETARAFVGYRELEPQGAEAALAGQWLPRVSASVAEVAAPWIGVGRGSIRFSVDCEAYNDRQCQRVRAEAGAQNAGVAQVVDLPAWRTTGYRLRGFVRSDGAVRHARAVLYHDGQAVDSAPIDGIGARWREFVADLETPRLSDPLNAFLLALVFDGPGSLDFDLVTLTPDDAVDGFDPQAVAQLRDLHTGWVRWPGGNYASDYHWRDGVGPRDLRPSTPNPSWPGLNANSVGTDEFLRLAEKLGYEVMITVNAGSGTAEEAAQWVEYLNGDTSTTLGRLRARNGHPEPYGVRYWNIGNELWGHWQIGYTNPDEHARRYAAFAQAMRAVDPSIRIIANAHGGHSESPPEPWNRPLLEQLGEQLEILDIHTYVGVPGEEAGSPERQAFLLSTIPLSYERWIMEFRQELVRRGLEHVSVIVGEYNASIRSGSEALDRVAALLAYGAYLHGFMRQGEYLVGANATEYSVFNPRALPFGRMHPRYDLFRTYAEQAGTTPVHATLRTPVRQQPEKIGRDVLPIFNLPMLDAVALRDPRDGSLAVSLLNRDVERAVRVEVALEEFRPQSRARWFLFEGEPGVGMRERPLDGATGFTVVLPPHSVSLLKLYPATDAPAGSAPDQGGVW